MMSKFKVGDRVICTDQKEYGVGTIINKEGAHYLVEFDKEDERGKLHSGDGKGKEHRCWWTLDGNTKLASIPIKEIMWRC